jgi:SM-20-related protein
MNNDIREIDQFLPADSYMKLLKYIQEQPMEYGSKSNSKTDPHGHWSWKPVHDNRDNLADLIWMLPLELVGAWNMAGPAAALGNNPVVRCYANGYTYGTDGYFHRDSEDPDTHTIILYMCEEWAPDWAGETVILNGNDLEATLPRPNRALIIPSNMLHAARAVSRKCTILRTTLMFKTRSRRSETFEKLSRFLVEHGALKHKHGKGTLHDHLMRTYHLLEMAPSHSSSVALAGGLHSVYGTNAFHQQILCPSPDNRAMVATEFGKEAEALAYTFSVLDRPRTLDRQHGPDLITVDLRYDQKTQLTPEFFRQLQLIECANLADQGSLDKWTYLKKFWEETK